MPKLEEVLPKYLQIAGHIRDQIARGDLQPGEEVPSERQIAADWNVARPTASKALDALRSQGLVESRQGSGTFVRSQDIAARARERYGRAHAQGTMYSTNETVEFLSAGIIPTPPSHVAHALKLAPDSAAIQRLRLISRSELGPVELSASWFAPELAVLAPRLLELERIRGGTAAYLAPMTGKEAKYCRDEVCARLASAEERKHLRLSEPAAVLSYRMVVYGEKDEPIQFDEAVYRPDTWVFRQEYAVA